MIPSTYTLRPSDWSSVPALFAVLGITSPRSVDSPAGGSVHRLGRSSVPMPPGGPHIVETVAVYHSRNTNSDKRRPFRDCPPNAHQTLYTPPGEPIFPGAGNPLGGSCYRCGGTTRPERLCADCSREITTEAGTDG
jgi:hypothetical protein